MTSGACLGASITIDDYSFDHSLVVTFTSFADGSMLGGERDYAFTGTFGSASSAGGVVTIGGPATGSGNIQMNYDGVDGLSGNAFGLGGVDLTDGGSNDRFLIDVTGIVGTVNLLVRVWEDGPNFSSFLIPVSGTGVQEVLFSSLSDTGTGGDVASAEQVGLWIESLDPDERIQISNFSTGPGAKEVVIPEPSTMGMLGLGIGVLVFLRRRRSA
jgi:PEP-CTERM motif-containing protein